MRHILKLALFPLLGVAYLSAAKTIPGTTTDATMTWDNITRYYEVYVPASHPTNPPMVVMLHGTHTDTTFDPQAIISLSWGWQAIADKYGFILVQPASTWNSKTHQYNWNAYFMDASFPASGGYTTPPDDSGFLRQLIVNLTAQYSINPKMVYVTGFSSGAQMTERVGVEISDLVAAIVPPPVLVPSVPPTNPISVQEWQGTLDQNLWPCGYGKTKYSGVTYTLDTVDDTFNYWAQQNACTVFQTTQTLCSGSVPNPNVAGNDATSCGTGNVEVQFIWEVGFAHAWVPSNDTARWQFMAAHPKP